MTTTAILRLEYLCAVIPPLLKEIDDEVFSAKPDPAKWSKKQIIGHLIDSATNNHQRFVRVQFEDKPSIRYDQDKWNDYTHYQQMNSLHVIVFWEAYNNHLVQIIKHIPKEALSRECQVGDNVVTLDFLINDYVHHMEHHLRQVVSY